MLAETIKNYLAEKDCLAVFEKKDGSIREMYCTNRPEFLSELEIEPKEDKKERKVNENVVCAYDTENNGWRSFRLDSLREFYTLEEDGDYYLAYQSADASTDSYLD